MHVKWVIWGLLSLFLSNSVWAQTTGEPSTSGEHAAVLVRGVGAGSDKAATLVAHYLRQMVQEDINYHPVALVEVLGNASLDRAVRDFQEADDLISRGRKAYEEFELDQTVTLLQEALARFERNAAYVRDFKKLSELLMLLGAVHSLRGEEKAATRRFGEAYSVDGAVEPDPSLFNPQMREQFRKAVGRLNRRPRGSLSITSNPSYGEVYLNGEFVGVTPMVLEGLLEGPHYIRIGRDGFRNWGKVVQVRGRREASANARLDPTEHFDRFDKLLEGTVASMSELVSFGSNETPGDSSVPETIEEVGTLLNADQVFWADVRLDGEQVRLNVTQVNLNGGSPEEKWVTTGSIVFSYDSNPAIYEKEVGVFYKKTFSREATASGGRARLDANGERLVRYGDETCLGMACQTFKRIVFGVGVGGGVALMGVGSIFWYQATEYNDIYRGNSNEPQPSQISDEAQELRNKGEPLAIVGDLFFGLGAAVSIGTVVWTLLYEPAPTADDVMEGTSGGWGFFIQPFHDGGLIKGQVRF